MDNLILRGNCNISLEAILNRRIFIALVSLFAGTALIAQTIQPTQTAPVPTPKTPALAAKIITLRMLDSRTGMPITPTNFLVRVNHEETAHSNWVTISADGTAKIKVSPKVSEFYVRGLTRTQWTSTSIAIARRKRRR